MALNTALDIKKYMTKLNLYEFGHISEREICNSELSLMDEMNNRITETEGTHTINSFSAASVLVKNFDENVAFGIIYNKHKSHFVMFRNDSLYDLIISRNRAYNITGYLQCCRKNPIVFMEKFFPKGILVKYKNITDFNQSCNDYFSNPVILYHGNGCEETI